MNRSLLHDPPVGPPYAPNIPRETGRRKKFLSNGIAEGLPHAARHTQVWFAVRCCQRAPFAHLSVPPRRGQAGRGGQHAAHLAPSHDEYRPTRHRCHFVAAVEEHVRRADHPPFALPSRASRPGQQTPACHPRRAARADRRPADATSDYRPRRAPRARTPRPRPCGGRRRDMRAAPRSTRIGRTPSFAAHSEPRFG